MKSKLWAIGILVVIAIVVLYINSIVKGLDWVPVSKPVKQTQTTSTPQTELKDWKTYTDNQFGFKMLYNADFISQLDTQSNVFSELNIFRVEGSSSPLFYDPVAESSVGIFLYLNPSYFISNLYNSALDSNNTVTYSKSKKAWLVNSKNETHQCPVERFTEQGAPYYIFETGIHAGAYIEAYVTPNGIIAVAGRKLFDGKITFDNPSSIIKVSCN